MKILFLLGLLLVLHNKALCKPVEDSEGIAGDYLQNDDYKTDDDYDDDSTDDDGEDETDEQFKFISQAQNISKPLHADVSFSCEISENPSTFTIMWKKNDEIIFQDRHIFTTFDAKKFILKNTTTLTIKDIDAGDAGEYSCVVIVSSNKEETLKHMLTIQTAAKITSLTSDASTYKSGDKLELTCIADQADAKITWSLNGQRLGTGSKLLLENIGHDKSGDYQCMVDNGIEPVDHKSVNIKIMHKPIVRLEKLTSINGDQYDIELRCTVRANPAPIVIWRKDGEELKLPRKKNNVYIMHLKNVDSSQFGKYSCSADNQVGKVEQSETITNLPSKALYKNGDKDTQGKEFNLEWEVESLYPITEYLLEYKKVSSDEWTEEHPEVTNSESGNLYKINYVLKNLEGGKYEVRVKSKNQWGWSEVSNVVTFTAHNAHHGHKEHKNKHANKAKSQNEESNDIIRESRVGGTNTNSGVHLVPSTTLLCLVALLMFNRH